MDFGAGEKPNIITVTRLNTIAGELLAASRDLNKVWVSGEVSNLTKHTSGHYYFTLKDDASEVRCTLFKSARAKVKMELDENMKVLVFGSTIVYVPKGSYQFNVLDVKAQGLGDLYLAYEALKRKLGDEGLFDPARKRALPRYPRWIGVVTSPTGAAIRDILNITARRFPSNVLIAPALVQGEGAAESIVHGIDMLNEAGVDVIIVGRGGGSLEDLWAFNEEVVARAIYASKIPVVSAVGHEVDFTISDFVADLRAPTPSAAAELVLPDRTEEGRNLLHLLTQGRNGLSTILARMRQRSTRTEKVLSPERKLREIEMHQKRSDELGDLLEIFVRRMIERDVNRLRAAEASLVGLDPMRVLERGYCVLRKIEGGVLSSVKDVDQGDELRITMRDGEIGARVTRKA